MQATGFSAVLQDELREHASAVATALICLALLGLLRLLLRPPRRPPMAFPLVCLGLYILTLPTNAMVHALNLGGRHDWVDLPASVLFALGIVQVAALILFDMLGRSIRKVRIVRTVVSTVAAIVIVLALVHHEGVNLSAIFATSAVLTGVIGFALQETLGNVIGGIALQLESTVAIGDWITVGEVTGQVVEVRWRSLSIVTRNDDMVIIPNGLLAKQSFVNLSRPVPWHRQWVHFDVHYRHPPNEVQQVVLEAVKGIPNVRDEPVPDCIFFRMEQDHAHYAVRYRLADIRHDDGTDSEVKKRIWYALRRHGIEIPYPSRNIFVTELSKERADAKWQKQHHARLASLRKVAIFAPLDEEHLELLADRCRVEVFGTGEIILRQSEPGDSLYVIRHGSVSIRVAVDGVEREVAQLDEGQIFGEMSLMTGEARKATAIAGTDAECYVIDRALFQEVLATRKSLVDEISAILAARQVELEGEVAQLGAARAGAGAAHHADLLDRIRGFFGLGGDAAEGDKK
ncbi:MAG: mechanosensitive ion channel [Myxococcales bacterium]|nr:mechanosensitive ion channel [Myxococcales bacterium]